MDAPTPRRAAVRISGGMLLAVVGLLISGCSLVTMAGKMFWGDPTITCEFTRATRIDLRKSQKTVAVVCTAPASVENEYPGINGNILQNVIQTMKREGVEVVSSSKMNRFLDDRHGMFDGPDDLAESIDADYIIHIEIEDLTHRVEKSPDLFQGKSQGKVHVYEVVEEDGRKTAQQVMLSKFDSLYPTNAPMSASRVSGEHFQREYVRRVSTQLAQKFYHHPASDTVH